MYSTQFLEADANIYIYIHICVFGHIYIYICTYTYTWYIWHATDSNSASGRLVRPLKKEWNSFFCSASLHFDFWRHTKTNSWSIMNSCILTHLGADKYLSQSEHHLQSQPWTLFFGSHFYQCELHIYIYTYVQREFDWLINYVYIYTHYTGVTIYIYTPESLYIHFAAVFRSLCAYFTLSVCAQFAFVAMPITMDSTGARVTTIVGGYKRSRHFSVELYGSEEIAKQA